jgi:hypothetical protein
MWVTNQLPAKLRSRTQLQQRPIRAGTVDSVLAGSRGALACIVFNDNKLEVLKNIAVTSVNEQHTFLVIKSDRSHFHAAPHSSLIIITS